MKKEFIKQNCPAPQGNSRKQKYSNSIRSQCTRLLNLFLERNKLNTFQIRNEGIMHPGGRVLDLRCMGHKIDLNWVREPDCNGVPHRVGLYVYKGHAKEARHYAK